MSEKAWVVGSGVSESFLGLTFEAAELAREQELELCAVLVCETLDDTGAGKLKAAGADRVVYIPLSVDDVNSEPVALDCLNDMAAADKPVFILFESSVFFTSVAPMLAAKLDCGITADCTALSWSAPGILRLTRPAFGGKKLAHNENKNPPTIATVRKGVYSYTPENSLPIKPERLECPALAAHWIRRSLEQQGADRVDLAGAKVIVSGGLGLGTKANYEKLRILADKLGASLGASRAAVAAGFAGYEHQVGQTGVSVRPEIYLAFGISGAVQHLAGISGAKYIYAVNNDPKAAIHEYSDFSVVADCVEVIDKLIEQL